MRRTFKYIFFLVLLVVLYGCQSGDKTIPKKVFLLQNTQEVEFEISTYEEKIETSLPISQKKLMIFFVNSSCGGCFEMLPHIQNISKNYKDLKIILVLTDIGKNQQTMLDNSIYIQKKWGLDTYYQTGQNGLFGSMDKPVNLPYVIIYDKQDEILKKLKDYEGIVPEEMFEFDLGTIIPIREKDDV